jgi:hypothetical protein
MLATLEILDASAGHLTLTWDPDSSDDTARARTTVDDLAAQGYVFFAVVGGETADPIASGKGRLLVEKIAPAEVAPEPVLAIAPAATEEETLPAEPEPPRKRGRPVGGSRTIATKPQKGG